MSRISRLSTAFSVAGLLLLGACAEAPSDEHEVVEPVKLEHVKGTDLTRVVLTPQAARRADIQTTRVERDGRRLVVPAAAVLFDTDGKAWVYTNPEPLTYVRHEIKIDVEEGDTVFLRKGPTPGTAIVTVGVPQLYGAEYEVGH